jgi:hypothetical protein
MPFSFQQCGYILQNSSGMQTQLFIKHSRRNPFFQTLKIHEQNEIITKKKILLTRANNTETISNQQAKKGETH